MPRSVREYANALAPEDYLTFDLDAFLRARRGLRTDRGELLRMLAVALENFACSLRTDDCELILGRIYERAERDGPARASLFTSWGVSLVHCAEFASGREAALCAEARRRLERSLELEPDEPNSHYVMGLAFYRDLSRTPTEYATAALPWFRRAAELDDGDELGQLPRLYVGHCEFDLKCWAEALATFEALDLWTLGRAWHEWRANQVRELRAECLLRLGRRDEALGAFREMMAAAAAAPDPSDVVEDGRRLAAAAAGELRAELYDEARRFLRAIDRLELLREARRQRQRGGAEG